VLTLRVLILEHDLEHLGEVLAEMMGGGTLDAATTDGNIELNCSGVLSTGEALIL